MQLHPSLSHQMTLTRERDARYAARRARLVRAARCRDVSPGDVRRSPTLRAGCPDPLPA